MSEYDFEPIRGLPADLPPGETILWQGAPTTWRLAVEAFHIRLVAAYFAAMIVWGAASRMNGGAPPAEAILTALSAAPIAILALALLLVLAWANSRTTVYTITNKRVVLRFGAAVPKAINLPFRIIASAAVNADAKGAGDVALTLTDENVIAFLHLWPHVRPFRFSRVQPTLRGLADARTAADILGDAVRRELDVALTPAPAANPLRRPGPMSPQTATA